MISVFSGIIISSILFGSSSLIRDHELILQGDFRLWRLRSLVRLLGEGLWRQREQQGQRQQQHGEERPHGGGDRSRQRSEDLCRRVQEEVLRIGCVSPKGIVKDEDCSNIESNFVGTLSVIN